MVILGAPSEFKNLIINYVRLLSLNNRMNNFAQKFKKEISSFSMAAFAKEIQIPGLIVHDVNDNIVSFAEGQKIAEAWKSSTFLQTKGLGHSLHNEEVYDRIVAFLKQ